jgi:AcrR family transcriptional regulator
MASSAVYRYFPRRDDLLTALIVDAYDALGGAAERADAAAPPDDLRARWLAVCRAVRAWAMAHPHEYALVYGSPVPGYAAPQATIVPASRVGEVLCRLVADGIASGTVDPRLDATGADATLAPGVAAGMGLPVDRTGSLGARAIFAWTGLYGMISFELFGHTNNVVADHDAFFDDAAARLATVLGLPAGTSR